MGSTSSKDTSNRYCEAFSPVLNKVDDIKSLRKKMKLLQAGKTSKLVLDTHNELDLEDPDILTMVFYYLRKYASTTKDLELKLYSSSYNSHYYSFPSDANRNHNHNHKSNNIHQNLHGGNNNSHKDCASIPAVGLVALIVQTHLRHNLKTLQISRGCRLNGNLGTFFEALPTLTNLQKLRLDNLRIPASTAALAFPSLTSSSSSSSCMMNSLEELSLSGLHGDFESLFQGLQSLPRLRILHLSKIYLCGALSLVEQASSILLANSTSLQELYLSFLDEYQCCLEPIVTMGLARNPESALRVLQIVQHEECEFFSLTTDRELDLFLTLLREGHNTTLHNLLLDWQTELLSSSSSLSSTVLGQRLEKIRWLDLYLRLNKYSASRLLHHSDNNHEDDINEKATAKKWVQVLNSAKQDVPAVFHLLSQDPYILLPHTSRRRHRSRRRRTTTTSTRKRKRSLKRDTSPFLFGSRN